MNTMRLASAALAMVLMAVVPGFARGDDEAAWSQRLREDAQRFHDIIHDSHPGPVDPLNPGFNRVLGDALRTALDRADRTRDGQGYWWALRQFQAAFDDGHVQLATTQASPKLPSRWPGFLTRYDGARQVVAAREDDAALPPIGAELLSCDGIPADTLAQELVGDYRGRWQLESQRANHGWRLFVDAGNPWVARPDTCVFVANGASRSYELAWRDLDEVAFARRAAQAQPMARAPIELRRTASGATWISFGTFDGDTQAESYPQLVSVVEAVRSNAADIRQGPVVLDVRGNGGGSSHWSRQVAEALWGKDAVRRATRASEGVDWRVSDANIAHVREFHEMLLATDDPDPDRLEWAGEVLSGLELARGQGRSLWGQIDDDDDGADDGPDAGRSAEDAWPKPRAFVLTDSACASACLDAMDLWKALGVVQVGRETSADTMYMEIRSEQLPSGLALVAIPTKVYRGRLRGSNEAYRPEFAYDGDLSDTAALEAWIASLPE